MKSANHKQSQLRHLDENFIGDFILEQIELTREPPVISLDRPDHSERDWPTSSSGGFTIWMPRPSDFSGSRSSVSRIAIWSQTVSGEKGPAAALRSTRSRRIEGTVWTFAQVVKSTSGALNSSAVSRSYGGAFGNSPRLIPPSCSNSSPGTVAGS